MSSSLDRILRPAFYDLVEDFILKQLASIDLINLELSSKVWRSAIVTTKIWKKRLDAIRAEDDATDAFCADFDVDEDFDDFDLSLLHARSKKVALAVSQRLPSSWREKAPSTSYYRNHNLESLQISASHSVLVNHRIAIHRPTKSLLNRGFSEDGIPLPLKPSAFCIVDDFLLCGDKSGNLRLFDLSSDRDLVDGVKAHESAVESVAFNANLDLAFSSAQGDGVKVWRFSRNALVLHQTLDCHTFNVVPLAVQGAFLIAAEGTANHIWQIKVANYEFYCYLNPRNGENIHRISPLKSDANFFASVDYSGNVFVWNLREKLKIRDISSGSAETNFIESRDFWGVATSEGVSLFDTPTFTLLRHIDLTRTLDVDRMSSQSYRLLYAAATASKLVLCYNEDVVILDFWPRNASCFSSSPTSPKKSATFFGKQKKEKSLFVPRERREKQISYLSQ